MKAITRWLLLGAFVALAALPAVVHAGIHLTLPPIPEEVAGFTAAGGNTQVFLTWVNPTNTADFTFAGVKIVRKTGNYSYDPTDGTTVYDSNGTNTVDMGLVNGTPYYYTAFCYDPATSYSGGSYATATPQVPDTTPPANVSGFSATGGDARVVLQWTNPTNADFAGVQIQRKTGSCPSNTTDGTTVYPRNSAPTLKSRIPLDRIVKRGTWQ